MLLPLFLLPYLISTLGKEIYGLTVFAAAIVGYFIVLVGFGFNLSATKEISLHRHNEEKIIEIFSSVMIIKIILLLISFLILSSILYFFEDLSQYQSLYYLSMLVCIGEVMLPIWYFQGIEKMKYITYLNITIRVLAAVLIVIFINSPKDYLLVPIFNGVGVITGSFISIYILLRHEKINFKLQKIETLMVYVKKSYIFFISNLAAIGKDRASIIFIGSFIGMAEVAYYDLAEKIVWAFRSIFVNLNNAFFPYMVKLKNKEKTKKMIKITFMMSVLAYFILIFFSKDMVLLLSDESMLPSVELSPILGLFLILAAVSSSIGHFILIANDLNKEYLQNLLFTVIVYSLLMLILYIFNEITLINIAIVYISSVFFEMIHRIYLCRENKLLDWIF